MCVCDVLSGVGVVRLALGFCRSVCVRACLQVCVCATNWRDSVNWAVIG